MTQELKPASAGGFSIRESPHGEIAERMAELSTVDPTVVFCNGPQCPATAQAIEALLAAGWSAERLLYYRGGIHDWVALGLPLAEPGS